MKISEVIDRILAYHPQVEGYAGCDEYKCGDPDQECTGIVTAMSATVHVIQKAVELGANLIVVHEPTNYTSADYPGWEEDFKNDVYAEKMRMLEQHGIVVWRDHDHMHMHRPDGIFTGVLKYLGWEEYAQVDTSFGHFAHFVVTFPEEQSFRGLRRQLKETIGMHGVRYVGPEEMPVKKLAIIGHIYPMPETEENRLGFLKEYGVETIRYFEEEGVDLLLPGETIDWTLLSYVRDAVQLGQKKAVVTLGHFNWEELGMRYAADWLKELVGPELSVNYVHCEDMYQYMTE